MLLPLACAWFLASQEAARPDPAVTRADLERTLRFLASDELAGRVVGSPEAMRAAEFLAAALARAGLQPGGDAGSFLQAVPLTGARFEAPPRLSGERPTEAPRAFVHGIDFDLSGLPPSGSVRIVRVAGPADLPAPDAGLALFLDGSSSERRAWLGAERGRGYGLLVTPGSEEPGQAESTPRTTRIVGDVGSQGPSSLRARGELLAALRAGALEHLRIEAGVKLEPQPAANVVGVLRGTGTRERPELAAETVVFSAHYDHLPARTAKTPGEDVILNGADDDASGCAAVLELAEALAAGPPPARTLVFLLATGEEFGLLGTDWYLEHPLVPLADTRCNLNFEMIGRPDALAGGSGKLWLTGDERSNLGDAFRALGLAVVNDPRPGERFFQRSDNYAFARRGIVAQTLSSFDLHTDYHGPDDEFERLDLVHLEAATRVALGAARALADGSLDPRWKPGGDPSRE